VYDLRQQVEELFCHTGKTEFHYLFRRGERLNQTAFFVHVFGLFSDWYISQFVHQTFVQGRTQGGGAAAMQLHPNPPPQKNINLKNTDFVDIRISEVLRDFPFSRSQPLNSTDD
jgi:hypothetical protein